MTSPPIPAEAATASCSSCRMRMAVASTRSARFVSSTIIWNSSLRSWDAASRPAMPSTVSSRSASSASMRGSAVVHAPSPIGWTRAAGFDPTIRRRIEPPAEALVVPAVAAAPMPPAPVTPVIGTAVEDPLRSGMTSAVPERARTAASSHRWQRSRGRHRYHRAAGPSSCSVDPPRASGLHSGGVATLRGPAVPARSEVHTPSWTTVPVPTAPVAASSPRPRSVPLADG